MTRENTKTYWRWLTLYGSPAQLVVRKDSRIARVKELQGKKVGVGNAGSGAFANCELFFTHLDIWDKIERNAIGYNDDANAFGNRQLNAFWLFTGFPSGAVMLATQTNDIDLIDLDQDAIESGFYEKYPYFTRIKIPAGTYQGVDRDAASFQDSALWVANAEVPDEIVYDLLSKIYTDEGLAYMAGQKKTFREMDIKTGTNGITTPLHPGAKKFWKEKGLLQRTYLSAAIGATRWVSVEVLKDRPAVSFSARSIRPRSRLAITRDPTPSQNSTTIHGEESQ